MKLADLDLLILPGLGNSGPDHWQSRWEKKLSTARRIDLPDWDHPRRDAWVERIVETVNACPRPCVIIAHSIGCVALAHAAPLLSSSNFKGAFMVGLSDWDRPDLIPGIKLDFAPIPRVRFAFPAQLVASRNDPYCDFEVASLFAETWGASLVDAGESGHINVDSGHGPWPEGLLSLAGFLRKL